MRRVPYQWRELSDHEDLKRRKKSVLKLRDWNQTIQIWRCAPNSGVSVGAWSIEARRIVLHQQGGCPSESAGDESWITEPSRE